MQTDPFISFLSDLSKKIQTEKEHKVLIEKINSDRPADNSKASLQNVILTIKEKIAEQVTATALPLTETTQSEPLSSSIIKRVTEQENNFGDFVSKLKGILNKDVTPIKEEIIEQPKTVTTATVVSSVSAAPVVEKKKPKASIQANSSYIEVLEQLKDGVAVEKEDSKVTEIKKLIEEYAEKYIRKAIGYAGESGGGTNAVQYANGGVMNGDLNVNGNYLSGGVNLLDIFASQPDSDNQTLSFNESDAQLSISNGNTVSLSAINTTFKANSGKYESNYTTTNSNSANWSEAYSNLTSNSAAYLSGYDLSALAAASGSWNSNYTTVSQNSAYWADTRNNVTFEKNVTIQGNLTALGTSTFNNTIFTTTSALSVVNLGPGPALYVYQASGPYDVASFYDGDGVEVLHVGNAQGAGNPLGQVGINTSDPSAELTVNGAISSNRVITVLGGNSNQWNSNYTSFISNSSKYDSAYTSFNSNSAKYDSNWTTTNTNSATWDAAYTNLVSNSANYLSGYNLTAVAAASATWDSNYTTTKTNSANWSSVYSSYNSISGRYTTLDYLSSNFIYLSGVYVGPNPIGVSAATPVSAMSGMYVDPVSGYAGFYTNAPVAPVDIRGSTKIIGFSAFGNNPTCLRIRDNYLYVLCQGNNTLNVFDTSTSVPQFVASAATYALGVFSTLAIQGKYAFVTTTAGIQSFDVSATTPVSAGIAAPQTTSFGNTFNVPGTIMTQGKYAYAVYSISTFPGSSLYNIVDIGDPTKLSHAIAPISNVVGGFANLTIQGNNLYYAYSFIGGNVIHQSNLSVNPVPQYLINGTQIQNGTVLTPQSMAVQGRYLYYSGPNNFYVIDTTRSGTNRIVATRFLENVFTTGTSDMVIQQQYAYVMRQSGIFVINISNPLNPVVVQKITIGLDTGSYRSMVIKGRYLYFTGGNVSTAIYRVDLGGSYIQQLQAGGIHTEHLHSNNIYAANEVAAIGGGSFGNGLNVQGAANVQGSLSVTPASGTQTIFSNYFSVVSSNPATALTVFAVTNANRVGIGTASPGSTLSVVGDISASDVMYAPGGNSNTWNAAYTTTNSNSANWSGAYTTFNANSSFYDAAVNELFTYVISETGDEFITEDSLLMVDSNIAGYPAWNSTTDTVVGLSAGWQNAANAVASNASNWTSTYTTTQANTAADSFDLSYTGTLTVPLIPISTVPQLRNALLGSSGSQAATLRNGKWISGLSITGYNNPTLDALTSLSSSDIVGIRDSFALSSLTRLTTLSFPALASVDGSFAVVNAGNMTSLTTASFPALVSVGRTFAVVNAGNMTSLTTASFPALVSVGSNFALATDTVTPNALTTASFPALVSVGGNFAVLNSTSSSSSLNALTATSFPALVSVGGNFALGSNNSAITNMGSLVTASFPALAIVGGSFTAVAGIPGFGSFSFANALTTASFPALVSVGGNFALNLNFNTTNALTTASFPALAIVGGSFVISSANSSMISFTTLLIGSTLKHINGDFSSGPSNSIGLDRHNAWSASTYYPSYTLFTTPASAFSSTTTGTTCTVNIVNHGLQTGDIITVSGITGITVAIHNFNVAAVAVTRISADVFTYTITATTVIASGTATIQRQEVAVMPVTKNGRKYICTGNGTSGGTEPAWPTTIGSTVADGTVTWTCSELSMSNILSRLDALNGTNQTTTYGANRFINLTPNALITINSISTSAGVATITTSSNHGITTGTQVVISGCTGTALRYNGVWTATSTGLTTLTTPVPTDLNGVAGAGTMRLTTSCPQFTGNTPISATTITGVSADSHMIPANFNVQLRDSDSGSVLPIFVAGIYNRNGTTNGFAKYSCTENGWDIWYDTITKRWVNSPYQFTGVTAAIGNYLHTAQSVPLASTSSANPAVITSSVAHGVATGAVFTVVIEGCSNAALNGSWTATSTGATTFTIPVDGSGGATTTSGTVAVLNQTFNQGRLMSSSVNAPVQGVQQTITTSVNHGFTTGDFIHFYGAVGTHATSINDLNTGSTAKSMASAITVIDATTLRCIRYSSTQPFVGSYSLTTMPHMRDPSINDTAYYLALKMRSRGVAVSLAGTTGI